MDEPDVTSSRRHAVRAGVTKIIVAGVVASIVFALFSMIWFAVAGEGFWRPLNLVAHTVWRQAPTDGGFHLPSVLLGAVVLVVIGVLVMVPFGAAGVGAQLGAITLILGAGIYANVVWVFGHYLIWKGVDRLAATEFSPGVAWLAHILAGLAGGTTLALLNTSMGRFLTRHRQAGRQDAQRI